MEARESSRQEIAKRLRNKYRERNAPGMFEAQDVGMQAYNYLKDLESCLPDGDSMFTVIADLIDPTCKPVGMNYLGNAPWHDGGVNLDALTTGCSVCGYPFGNGRYYIPGRPNTIPRYCPNCGARLVTRDEHE